MYTNQVFELSMTLDTDDFKKIFNEIRKLDEADDYFIDRSMTAKGVTVLYRNSQYKKKIKIIVNSYVLLGSKERDPNKLIHKLDKRIAEYFDERYSLNDFSLTGLTLINDINVGSRNSVTDYLKVLKRIGKVKGYSPAEFEGIDNGFCLSGNSNGIDFLIYSIADFQAKFKGILRSELRLTEMKTIREYTNKTDTDKQIASIYKKSTDIFMSVFTHIIPYGDFYKKGEAVKLIGERVKDTKLRRRMIRLVTLIPEKRSLILAQKAMKHRRVDELMEEFAKIGVSPVTIGKRQDINFLQNLYVMLT